MSRQLQGQNGSAIDLDCLRRRNHWWCKGVGRSGTDSLFTKLIPVLFNAWLAGAMVACCWWIEDWVATVAVEPIETALILRRVLLGAGV